MAFDIVSNDFRRAGSASRAMKEQLKRIGADAAALRRAMIAAYEAEMNVVIHSYGGRLEARLSEHAVDVDVIDNGPGIPDVELAMQEGYSTAGPEVRALGFGAGMGLPNIKRNTDRLRITSRVGEGTRVSFRVNLQPASVSSPYAVSLHAQVERCRECRRCLTACPTQALRVRNSQPSLLEHLCIDCAACIEACKPEALTVQADAAVVADLGQVEQTVLAVPPALLAACGPRYSPLEVLAALQALGFAAVATSTPFETALREAATVLAEGKDSAEAVIVPVCPAVINLVQLRFPSLLPLVAPFLSPWEALRATLANQPLACVVSCPAQRSVLMTPAAAAPTSKVPASTGTSEASGRV